MNSTTLNANGVQNLLGKVKPKGILYAMTLLAFIAFVYYVVDTDILKMFLLAAFVAGSIVLLRYLTGLEKKEVREGLLSQAGIALVLAATLKLAVEDLETARSQQDEAVLRVGLNRLLDMVINQGCDQLRDFICFFVAGVVSTTGTWDSATIATATVSQCNFARVDDFRVASSSLGEVARLLLRRAYAVGHDTRSYEQRVTDFRGTLAKLATQFAPTPPPPPVTP